jgi:hypothetical protein
MHGGFGDFPHTIWANATVDISIKKSSTLGFPETQENQRPNFTGSVGRADRYASQA